MIRILHLSDVHFGWPAVPAQADAVEAMAQGEHFDVVAVSGDLAQRARAGEFQRAAVFLRDISRPFPPGGPPPAVITVPGNHDVAWWFAPFGVGRGVRLYEKYRRYITPELEPVVRAPGVTLVGLNTAPGVHWFTLTWDPHDVSVVGALRPRQLEHAASVFAQAPASDARVVVMHHNPLRGAISSRIGLLRSVRVMRAFGAMGVDLVLCGHDHQESVHGVQESGKGIVVSTAGTLSSRSRGGRPSSFNVVTVNPTTIEVETRLWSAMAGRFEPQPVQCFAR
jgi:3',5'-cyclic AMP phosphodiesterase CpdA